MWPLCPVIVADSVKLMRPAPLDDLGITIPDMDGKTTHSINNYEDAEFLYIIDQTTFLIMRHRGK